MEKPDASLAAESFLRLLALILGVGLILYSCYNHFAQFNEKRNERAALARAERKSKSRKSSKAS